MYAKISFQKLQMNKLLTISQNNNIANTIEKYMKNCEKKDDISPPRSMKYFARVRYVNTFVMKRICDESSRSLYLDRCAYVHNIIHISICKITNGSERIFLFSFFRFSHCFCPKSPIYCIMYIVRIHTYVLHHYYS